MAGKPKAGGRSHKATYARDKKNPGQYLIRVSGPSAAKFAGRSVPVTRKDDSEDTEELETCIWAGVDEETHDPVALYKFKAKPKTPMDDDEIPF